MSMIQKARKFLEEKYSVKVPEEWLSACIDYITETPDVCIVP